MHQWMEELNDEKYALYNWGQCDPQRIHLLSLFTSRWRICDLPVDILMIILQYTQSTNIDNYMRLARTCKLFFSIMTDRNFKPSLKYIRSRPKLYSDRELNILYICNDRNCYIRQNPWYPKCNTYYFQLSGWNVWSFDENSRQIYTQFQDALSSILDRLEQQNVVINIDHDRVQCDTIIKCIKHAVKPSHLFKHITMISSKRVELLSTVKNQHCDERVIVSYPTFRDGPVRFHTKSTTHYYHITKEEILS